LIEAARAFEAERYVAATLAREPERSALVALAAFAADLRRIPSTVKEPMMGEIRLQWWRDAIEAISETGAASGHPIADALAAAVRRYALPKAMLVAMTEARAFDLYGDPMPDRASLDGYLAKTEAIPFALALRVATGGDETPQAITDAAGRAFGRTRLLAELPRWLARGRLPLPLDLLGTHGIDPDDLLQGRAPAGLRTLVDELAGEIELSMGAAASHFRRMPRRHRVPLAALATVRPLLARVRDPSRDAVRQPADLAPLARVTRIARAHLFGL
jgi:phytoene synthase